MTAWRASFRLWRTTASFDGNRHTPEFGLLAAREELADLAQALVELRPRRIWFAFVDPGGQGIAACRGLRRRPPDTVRSNERSSSRLTS